MKISEQEISRLLAASPTARTRTRTAVTRTESGIPQSRQAAQIEISSAAREINQIKGVINQLPDVREDRVQALKAQIENGTYKVSGEDIADLIIRRALADNTAL